MEACVARPQDRGRTRAFLGSRARRGDRELPARRRRPARHRPRRCAPNPGIVYCSTSGYGQRGSRSQWAGHDLNYLAVGGYLDCSGRNAEGGPALPGATVGDAAGGGMQAVIAILAALVHRAATGEGATLDVSVADGVVALMSLYVDEYLATGGSRARATTSSPAATRATTCTAAPTTAGSPWARSSRTSSPTCAGPRLRAVDRAPDRRRRARRDARRLPRVRAPQPRRWVADLGPADTCVSEVASVPELVAAPHFRERGCSDHAQARRLRAGGLGARGHGSRATRPGGA